MVSATKSIAKMRGPPRGAACLRGLQKRRSARRQLKIISSIEQKETDENLSLIRTYLVKVRSCPTSAAR